MWIALFELLFCSPCSFTFCCLVEQWGFWCFKNPEDGVSQWDLGPSNPSPGGMFLSTKPEGLYCPICLLQPQMCLILGHFCETSWITGPQSSLLCLLLLEVLQPPRGSASVWCIQECFLSWSRLLDRSLIPSPSLFSPRKVSRCSTLVESLLMFFFFKSPPEAFILYYSTCVCSVADQSAIVHVAGLDSDLPIHLWNYPDAFTNLFNLPCPSHYSSTLSDIAKSCIKTYLIIGAKSRKKSCSKLFQSQKEFLWFYLEKERL